MAESTSGIHHLVSASGSVGPVSPKWQDCLGSPTPFNLVCFAMTALFSGMSYTHWIDPVKSQGLTVAVTLFFGGFGMVIGSLLEWIKGNTFGFTVFASYGFYHISYAMSVIFPNKGLVATGAVDAGTYAGYFWGWLILSIFMFTYTVKHTGAFTLLFSIVLAVFVLLAIGNTVTSSGHPNAGEIVLKAEGYLVMLFALLGLYLAAAEINLWYPYPIVTIVSDPITGEAKSATVAGMTKTSSSANHHHGSQPGIPLHPLHNSEEPIIYTPPYGHARV